MTKHVMKKIAKYKVITYVKALHCSLKNRQPDHLLLGLFVS